jgi:gallate dioxygenase
MADIIGAIGVPHNPNFPERVAREGMACATAQSYRMVAAEFTALKPDLVLIFTTDHLNTFFFENLPILAIGVDDEFAGPNDEVPTVSYRNVPSMALFARHLHTATAAAGFELASVQEFEVDHSVIVPLHFLNETLRVPVIPIFISTHWAPRPTSRRCFALGQTIRAAVQSWPETLRVLVVGSGSFSFDVHGHLSPPGRLVGVPDPAWVYRVGEHLQRNAVSELIDEATPERFNRAGNVSGEILNWIAMLGTLDSQKLACLRSEVEFGNSYAVWR